jgi:hypothetical protein
MIARQRGDTCAPTRWRPSWPVAAPTSQAEIEERLEEHSTEWLEERRPADPADARRSRSRAPIAVATVIAVVLIAAQQHAGRAPAKPALPSTPAQWVARWTAASAENSARACSRLFAPALAEAPRSEAARTCTSYHGSVKNTSVQVRRVLEDSSTATVEAQRTGRRRNRGYLTFVLSHVDGGWQAIDVVPGVAAPSG